MRRSFAQSKVRPRLLNAIDHYRDLVLSWIVLSSRLICKGSRPGNGVTAGAEARFCELEYLSRCLPARPRVLDDVFQAHLGGGRGVNSKIEREAKVLADGKGLPVQCQVLDADVSGVREAKEQHGSSIACFQQSAAGMLDYPVRV